MHVAWTSLPGPGGVRVMSRPASGAFASTQALSTAGDQPRLVTRRRYAAVVFATESRQGEFALQISVRG